MTHTITTRTITTRTITAALASAAFIATAGAAHASDEFTATFNYDASATAVQNLENFQTTASMVCAEQLLAAGFRKTDSVSFKQRKCERQLVKKAVKATRSDALALVYAAKTNPARRTAKVATQMASK